MTIVTLAILLLTPMIQEENSLEKGWPVLQEAWRAIESNKHQNGIADDNFIRLMGAIHDAYKAAGFFEKEMSFEAAAFKQLFTQRMKRTLPAQKHNTREAMIMEMMMNQGLNGKENNSSHFSFGLESLLASIVKLRSLKKRNLDDEDNVADEKTIVRKSLKGLKMMSDETPLWIRRRLVLLTTGFLEGGSYPQPAKPSPELLGKIKSWMEELSSEDIQTREKAVKNLMKHGEPAGPLLRKMMQTKDPETLDQVKRILGIGHEPWKASAQSKGNKKDQRLRGLMNSGMMQNLPKKKPVQKVMPEKETPKKDPEEPKD